MCRHILVKDVEGFKFVKSAIARLTGREKYSPVRVLRGELLEPHAKNNPTTNFRIIHDHSVLMFVEEEDLVPLNKKEEFLLLEAIHKPSDRFAAFIDGTLELGLFLEQNSIVFVDMYDPGNVKKTQVKGTVMYKGEVNGVPGTLFGIKVS